MLKIQIYFFFFPTWFYLLLLILRLVFLYFELKTLTSKVGKKLHVFATWESGIYTLIPANNLLPCFARARLKRNRTQLGVSFAPLDNQRIEYTCYMKQMRFTWKCTQLQSCDMRSDALKGFVLQLHEKNFYFSLVILFKKFYDTLLLLK